MDEVGQIRERLDIVQFISEYIPLKKMGRNFTALCPFHSEKSPSFVVSPERQIWHCFGCGKGGDAFTFLMEYERLEFVEALRILAKKTGVEIKKFENYQGSSKKEKLYTLNNLASEYYHYILLNHKAGRNALDYLIKERKLNKKLIETFNIGYAPGGDSLAKYLIQKKKYSNADLFEAGLIYQAGSRVFDFFRNRIIFPLVDQRGNTVGFSARIIKGEDGPKYINSRETLLYHKGSMFFGLNRAWEVIKTEQNALIMEGEFDVISAFKEGVGNAVAIKGTALTKPQAMLISRLTPTITLCLDQDEAGFEATRRSLPILEERSLNINVVKFTQGKDPDEEINQNPAAFKKDLKQTVPVYDFVLERLKERFNTNTAQGKKNLAMEMLPIISGINNEIIKEHYLKKLSLEIDTTYDSLVKQLDKSRLKASVEEAEFAHKDKRDRREVLEEYLLAILVQNKKTKEGFNLASKILNVYQFKNVSFAEIYNTLGEYIEKQASFEAKLFSQKLSGPGLKAFDSVYLLPLPDFSEDFTVDEELRQTALELRKIYLKEKIIQIGDKLKSKEVKGSMQEEKLREELNDATKLLSTNQL